jgi:hypothetical protein
MFPLGKSIHGEPLSEIFSKVVKRKLRASNKIPRFYIRNKFIEGKRVKKLHKSAQKGAAKIAAPSQYKRAIVPNSDVF